jgi:hypothetical protein
MKNLIMFFLLVAGLRRGLRKISSSLAPQMRFNPLILQHFIDGLAALTQGVSKMSIDALSPDPTERNTRSLNYDTAGTGQHLSSHTGHVLHVRRWMVLRYAVK